ncbi:MAG: chemotaxis protein [Desulfovibrio sp.]
MSDDKLDILLETGTNELEILEFFINEKTSSEGLTVKTQSFFGVNVAKVMQVIESPHLEQLESVAHPSFLGTIPLRDLILPVIDLSTWLGMDKSESEQDIVIVTEFSNTVSGFLVSGVTEIHRVGWDEVIPPGEFMAKIGNNSIVGLVPKDEHFIQLLDLESIISDLSPEEEEDEDSKVFADKQYKAVVCDDSTTIRTMLEQHMTGSNFDVRMLTNGKEALDTLMQYKEQSKLENRPITDFVDVLISDIEMPLMDGFTLTKNIKEDDVLSGLPVILYSSIITDALRHKGDSVGADDQVSKPDLNKMAGKALQLIHARDGVAEE